jgi:hypothetical protein
LKLADILRGPDYFYVIFYYDQIDAEADALARQYLVEGGKTHNLGQGRMIRFDKAHVPPPAGQDHFHAYLKGKSLFSLNKDGSAHDGSHGIKMEKAYTEYVKAERPDWKLPPNHIIEGMLLHGVGESLVEASTSVARPVLLDPRVITAAINIASANF